MKRIPIAVSGIIVAVIALLFGCDSPVTSGTAGLVTFSPAAGTFNYGPTVTLTTDASNAVIYYTVDGSTPTAASTRYTEPFAIGGAPEACRGTRARDLRRHRWGGEQRGIRARLPPVSRACRFDHHRTQRHDRQRQGGALLQGR